MHPNAPPPLDPRHDLLKAHVKTYTTSKGVVVSAHETKAPAKKVEAYGVKGMKSTPWRKTFKSAEHLHKWTEENGAEVHGQREVEDGWGPSEAFEAGAAALQGHPMWSPSDYKYFKDKGYTDAEVKAKWDADHAAGTAPVHHQPIPDVVGYISGQLETMSKADADKVDLLKAHVNSYTKKSGTTVNAHDDKRPGAKPKPSGGGGGGMPKKADAASGKADPIATHADDLIDYEEEYAKENQGVLDDKVLREDCAAFHSIALAMKAGNAAAVKAGLSNLDTAPRDEVFDFIDPRLWQSLGFDPTNPQQALQDYQKKWGAGETPKTYDSGALGKKVTVPDNEDGAASSGVKKGGGASQAAPKDAGGSGGDKGAGGDGDEEEGEDEPDVHSDDAQKQLLDAGARNVKKHDAGIDYHDKGGSKQTLPAKKKDDGSHYAKHADVQQHVAGLGGGDDDPASQGQGLDAENAAAQKKAKGAQIFNGLTAEEQAYVKLYLQQGDAPSQRGKGVIGGEPK